MLWPFLAIALPTLAALLAAMPAVDLAYHLRAGGSILVSHAIPTVDSWTTIAYGMPWLDQQWGAQVLLALVYQAGSWTGLAILRAAVVALTCWLLLSLVRRRAPSLGSMGATLLVLATFMVMANALALRPQLFAIPLFVLELVLIADREAHPRRLWAIPLITALWANLHGTFPLALVVLAISLVAGVLDRRFSRTLGVVTLASAAATLVNPFGIGVWQYVVNVSANPAVETRISEWRPPTLTDPAGFLFYLSVVAVLVLLVVDARRAPAGTSLLRRLPGWPGLATLIVFGALAAVTARGIAWWPPAALFVVAPIAADSIPVLRFASSTRPSRLNASVITLMVVVGLALLPAWRPLGPAGVPVGTLSYAPQGIAAALQKGMDRTTISGVCGGPSSDRMWVPQVWASWFEFAAPNWKYEVDSRIEIFPAYAWNYYDAMWGNGDLLFACRHQYTWVVVMPSDTVMIQALEDSGQWLRVYSDDDGAIWARQ
jgi:hypothetical protein